MGAARAVENAQAELDALGTLRRGKLRLGLGSFPCDSTRLVDALALFGSRHPGVQLCVTEGTGAENIDAVLSGALDVGHVDVARDEVAAGLRLLPLVTDPLVLLLPHGHSLDRTDPCRPDTRPGFHRR